MILVSRNIRYLRIGLFAGILKEGRQTTVGLSTTTFFGYFGDYFFGNFREKASNVCSVQTKTNKKAVLWQGTTRCRCKIRYVSKFVAASRCSPCDSTAFLSLLYVLTTTTTTTTIIRCCHHGKAFVWVIRSLFVECRTALSNGYKTRHIYSVGQKSKPAYFCNNFVYGQPIFILFGTYTLEEICNQRIYSEPT